MSKRTRTQPQSIEGLEALHGLLSEARLLASLLVSIKPQTLMLESEHLAAVLVGFADRLEAAIRSIPAHCRPW